MVFDQAQLEALQRDIYGAIPKITVGVALKVYAAGDRVADLAREAVPVGEPTNKRPGGDLKRSIAVRADGPTAVIVEATKYYGLFIEYGTTRNGGPRPFLWPAAEIAQRELIKAVEEMAGRAI